MVTFLNTLFNINFTSMASIMPMFGSLMIGTVLNTVWQVLVGKTMMEDKNYILIYYEKPHIRGVFCLWEDWEIWICVDIHHYYYLYRSFLLGRTNFNQEIQTSIQ